MSEPDVERLMRRAKIRSAWRLGLLYSKPLPYVRDKVQELRKALDRVSLETTMFEHFIDSNHLDALDCGLGDWSNESSTSVYIPAGMSFMKTGKRSKKRELSLEHKLSTAHHYLQSIIETYEIRKRNAHAYFIELLAAHENQEVRWKTTQNETSCMISKLGPAVCFPKKKSAEVRGRGYLSSAKWRAAIVSANHTHRDRLIRSTMLENVSLLQQIKNVDDISRFEEKVDVAEFLRKMLEKCSFPTEIKQIANNRGKLQRHWEAVDRKAYKLRRVLEKEVTNGDELRGRIARDKKTIEKVEHSLSMANAAIGKERAQNKKLTSLMDDYRGPAVHEYILLCRKGTELAESVKRWRHKVAHAKIVMDMTQQKWKRVAKTEHLTR